MTDFSTFDIKTLRKNPAGLYNLGNGAISKLAYYFDHTLPAVPTVANLFELVGKVGSNKELQANVARASQTLGQDGTTIAAEILGQSGLLRPLNRSFGNTADPVLPDCNLVITGGVANWMIRRADVASRISPVANPNVYLATGNRVMKNGEHQRVETLAARLKRQPTEQDFASHYLLPELERDGFNVTTVCSPNERGDEVFATLLALNPELWSSRILIVGNAPGTWHTAGQFRSVAREFNANFDSNGKQLFVRSDKFSLAEDGDTTADGQNPVSGLGALARAAAFILKAVIG